MGQCRRGKTPVAFVDRGKREGRAEALPSSQSIGLTQVITAHRIIVEIAAHRFMSRLPEVTG